MRLTPDIPREQVFIFRLTLLIVLAFGAVSRAGKCVSGSSSFTPLIGTGDTERKTDADVADRGWRSLNIFAATAMVGRG